MQVQKPGSIVIMILLVDKAPAVTFAFLFRSKCSCCLCREEFNGETTPVSMNHRQAEPPKKWHLLFKGIKQILVRMYREHKQKELAGRKMSVALSEKPDFTW